MYANTGKGSNFFERLYDWIDVSQIRQEPSTKEDFLEDGLSEEDFADYIDFVKRLYGVYFISNNLLAIKYEKNPAEMDGIWEAFTDFCIDHNLILEFADREGNRMPVYSPPELGFFRFIYSYPECPDTVHICSVDEFRLAVEMVLAEKSEDWYLDLRYNTRVSTELEHGDLLVRFDSDKREDVPLTAFEAKGLLSILESDLRSINQRIDAHNAKAPQREESSQSWQADYSLKKMQETWLAERIALDAEYSLVFNCYEPVQFIIDSGAQDEIYPEYPDETLYIHKGNIVCLRNHHRVEQATAILMDKSGKDIELNVSHCLECNRFFLDYSTYQHYREKYGTILGNIHMTKNGEYTDDSFELADESPLRLCGYSVSQKAGLNQAERQTIIESCIRSGAMTKNAVIHLLNWFVDVNGAKKGNELAMRKWADDLDFVLALDTPRQAHYRITKIEKYPRNRFCCGAKKPKIESTKKVDSKPIISYLGKRVKHKSTRFGAGIVISENSSSVKISFDNGITTSFLRDSFTNGQLTVQD